jgi:hypothetical protein
MCGEARLGSARDVGAIAFTSQASLTFFVVRVVSSFRWATGTFTATFIIDTSEQLWVADRHSEHVSCADGQDVLAAGEITFERAGNRIDAVEVTNQSTGFCPEPSCWSVVARVLDCIGISHPPQFTRAFEFRRCNRCGGTNIIKDNVFECIVCNAPLSHDWNYSKIA